MIKKKNKEIPVEINQSYIVDILDLTKTGEGIAKKDGFTIFVDNAVPEDKVEVKIKKIKSNYAIASVIKYINNSSKRCNYQFCNYEDNCGGCQYSKLKYNEQLLIKEKQVKDALERIGGFKNLNILPVIGSPEKFYRNKAQFKVNKSGLGFYEKGTHNIVNFKECNIQQESINNLIPILNKLLKKYKISIYNEETGIGLLKGILIRSNLQNELMLVFIINGNSLPEQEKFINELKKINSIIEIYLNINKGKDNKVLGKENILIYKTKDLIENLGDKNFYISPTSFFQVNSIQAETLYSVIKNFANIHSDDYLLDLYCGTGSIGIYLSNINTNLIGVELNPAAINDANKNAKLNGLKNYNFYCGKAEEVISKLTNKPTCIILDPPRKGCDITLLEYILSLKTNKIVYVSCNPTTLARDLKILANNYNIEKVQPIDLFPQTGHIETVVLLILKNNFEYRENNPINNKQK